MTRLRSRPAPAPAPALALALALAVCLLASSALAWRGSNIPLAAATRRRPLALRLGAAAAAAPVEGAPPGMAFDVASLVNVGPLGGSALAIDMPRVIPPSSDDGKGEWLLWFQVRDSKIAEDVVKLSTGRILFATSKDGLRNWALHEDSPVINPHKESGDWFYFDSEHVGLGDVITPGAAAQSKFAVQNGIFLMYIFGGRNEVVKFSDAVGAPSVKGLRMEIGVAVSQDGAHWSRVEGPNPYGSILEPGKGRDDVDHEFVGWPCVIETDGEYRMYYHTFDARAARYRVCLAIARDGLMNWKKQGVVFQGAADGGDGFDALGASRRHVVKLAGANGGYKMWYEGISRNGVPSIGCASSPDGLSWTRLSQQPVLQASPDPDMWDSGGVGSPHVVWMDDVRRWRMYYSGFSAEGGGGGGGLQVAKSSIGVAESVDEEGLVFKRI